MTPFKPGPVVGELQKAGLPAAIEQGYVQKEIQESAYRYQKEIERKVREIIKKDIRETQTRKRSGKSGHQAYSACATRPASCQQRIFRPASSPKLNR
jgi:hypothetical protein